MSWRSILPSAIAALVVGTGGCGGAGSADGSGGAGGGLSNGDGGQGAASSTHATTHASTHSSSHSTGPGGSGPTNIKHVVLIVQENHTFDGHFGSYCQAPPFTNPTCNIGPGCCEAAPISDPSGVPPTLQDDFENGDYDPNHTQSCELEEMDGGLMDQYASGASCSDVRNVAVSPPDVVAAYHQLAASYAIADRYFQPIVGQSSSNDMYLAVANYVFTDNDEKPDTIGAGCSLPGSRVTLNGSTIGDVVLQAGHTFGVYIDGYRAMLDSCFICCPSAPSDCPFGLPITPCNYDPSDVPFQYYEQFADNPNVMFDTDQLASDVAGGTLPDFSYVKGVGYHNEHPGYGTTLSQGIAFSTSIVDLILNSAYADDTLVLITWDEGGGFYDHVTPPPDSLVDFESYGTRVPLIAVGRFAKQNYVSHVEMEHSSIVKFVEYNFTGDYGQLGARDLYVNNIGDLLDPKETGLFIPSH